jgi:hypothetical protein
MDWSVDWTAVFTGLLVFVTAGLVWVGWRQIQDARVLQRAYVSALPGGISTTTHGELLAHESTPTLDEAPVCMGTGHLCGWLR